MSLSVGGEKSGAPAAPPVNDAFDVDSDEGCTLLGPHFFLYSSLQETGELITVTIPQISSEVGANLRSSAAHKTIWIIYGSTAAQVFTEAYSTQHAGGKAETTIVLRRQNPWQGALPEAGWGGSPPLSADQIAELRASRILFNEPAPIVGHALHALGGPEMLIRGPDIQFPVERSPLPELLAHLSRGKPARAAWVQVRLLLIFYLCRSECVETVDLLRLTIAGDRLKRITFRGTRRRVYDNVPPKVIELQRDVDL